VKFELNVFLFLTGISKVFYEHGISYLNSVRENLL